MEQSGTCNGPSATLDGGFFVVSHNPVRPLTRIPVALERKMIIMLPQTLRYSTDINDAVTAPFPIKRAGESNGNGNFIACRGKSVLSVSTWHIIMAILT